MFGLPFVRRELLPALEPRILFIIGTGRSGTHFLTKCLIGHKDIKDLMDGRENPRVFSLITNAAIDSRGSASQLRVARRRYLKMARSVSPAWFVDQSHPNIWHAEHWTDVFPSCRFVGIIRNPYSVVSSMLQHRGVRRWVEQWENYPVPNRFLGITPDNVERYRTMTIAERCTLRWVAHYKRMQQLKDLLGARIHLVSFEQSCENPHAELAGVAQLAGIEPAFKLPEINMATLTKYQSMAPADMTSVTNVLTDENLCELVR